jgi:hypothetical protein
MAKHRAGRTWWQWRAGVNSGAQLAVARSNPDFLYCRLLLRAIAIGRRRHTLKDTTLKQFKCDYPDPDNMSGFMESLY